MLKLPVYPINGIYYLHTRVNGKQVKKSLRTKNTLEAKLRALKWLEHFEKMSIRTFKVNLDQGIFQAKGPEDTQLMIRFLELAKGLELLNSKPPQPTAPQPAPQPAKADRTGLRVGELAEKFFLLKKQLKQSTALAYKTAINEFAGFIGNPLLEDVESSDVSRWLEHLSKTNETRTIDNKLGVLSSLFNFAIKHSYYHKPNPASGRKLMSKKDKTKSGYGIFEDEQIQAIFQKQHMDTFKEKDPDFYYCLLLELITGCRISEVTSLEVSQVRNTPTYHLKIKDAKTSAGIRDAYFAQRDRLFRSIVTAV